MLPSTPAPCSPRRSALGRLALAGLLGGLSLGWPTAGLGGCAPVPAPAIASPPSIALLVADSLAAGHTQPYGCARPTTPHLAELAERGVVFERVWSTTAWTLPAVASLFTGLSQEEHGLRTLGDRLPDDVVTLAEELRSEGYRTVAVVQNPLLDEGSGLARGFDAYTLLDWQTASARRAVALALEAWGARAGRPTFLYVHLVPPHMPYQPPAPYRGLFAVVGDPDEGSVARCRALHELGAAPDDPRVLQLALRYDEHVRFADELLGELIDGLGSEALLAVVSDHGEAFLEHGSQGHNATVYEEMVRVPWILAGPGVPAGRRVSAPASLVDVGFTLEVLAGLRGLSGRDGDRRTSRSLARAWAVPPPERALFMSSRYENPAPLQLAVIRGAEKLVVHADGSRQALYDLDLDPHETFDLSLERPERTRELADLARSSYAARRTATPRAGVSPHAAELSQLGYLGPEPPTSTRR